MINFLCVYLNPILNHKNQIFYHLMKTFSITLLKNNFMRFYSFSFCFLLLRLSSGLILFHIWNDFPLSIETEQIYKEHNMISFFHVLILIKMLCTFYVLIGFFTRIVLLVLIVLQLFLLQNILKIHPSTFYEVEVNLMYLFIYIIIFFVGSGRYSVDRLIEKHHEKFQL